ncbi:response regulator [Actinosynnema sp. NPDC047251]|uniref:Transcriptional regulatory protein n=1 Tax=Saccharothrix espanaensis (strain ATCC 51144 / DSM 44229 / JCM 9112 / NBRC 15066 / NRRL 15764) TaxID=1179773 RepID=K0JUV6_SACES|nr:response regulator [Saccharothrix espanaensis]CCH31610.1 Two-component system, repsonse regulator,possibly regulating citrate/malate metabolism [Saccharothrix espanaensis DSM 44229]
MSVRTLVVDDDFAVAAVHRGFLEALPEFSVVGEAHGGGEALRAVEALRPDLVLLDIHLPDLSGLEVLARLRGRSGPPVDVIAVTAARERETVRQAMSRGVDHYLVKPFTRTAFQDRMRQYLARRTEVQRLGQWLDQDEVDRLLQHRPRSVALPKGLSAVTLRLVTDALRDCAGDLSAQEVGERAGMSRVSARRYLEHLVTVGKAEVQPRYGMANRPSHGYRLT